MTSAQKSLKRLFRQLIFIPFLHRRWLTYAVKDNLNAKIKQAETGHQGEIVLVVEEHLPIHQAYYYNCHQRALDVFGLCRVWDTQNNTGVLIYVNLCEKDLQIIADRGIYQKINADIWQNLCQEALQSFHQKQWETGLSTLIDKIGEILRTHDPKIDTHGDELANDVIFLT